MLLRTTGSESTTNWIIMMPIRRSGPCFESPLLDCFLQTRQGSLEQVKLVRYGAQVPNKRLLGHARGISSRSQSMAMMGNGTALEVHAP